MSIFSRFCSNSAWTFPGRLIVYHLAQSRPVLTHKIIRFLQETESKYNPFFVRIGRHDNPKIIRALSREHTLEKVANIVGACLIPPEAAFMFYPVWTSYSIARTMERKKIAKEHKEFYEKIRTRADTA